MEYDARFMGRMIKYAREAKNLTQDDAAIKLNISESFYLNFLSFSHSKWHKRTFRVRIIIHFTITLPLPHIILYSLAQIFVVCLLYHFLF